MCTWQLLGVCQALVPRFRSLAFSPVSKAIKYTIGLRFYSFAVLYITMTIPPSQPIPVDADHDDAIERH